MAQHSGDRARAVPVQAEGAARGRSSRTSRAPSRSSAARRSPSRAGEMRRAIENVEVACGTPMLIQGYNSEDIAAGIDEIMIRQPLGVCAIIAPFNFPGMIPFWFLPYAMACGNTVVIKPSERVPLTMQKVCELIDAHRAAGGRRQSREWRPRSRECDCSIIRPIRSISFVGSSAVARHVYARAAAAGKRAQCQGGAKNPVVVLPDADLASAARDHCRQRVRMRRPTVPGHVAGDYRRRRATAVHRRHPGEGAERASPATGSTRRADGSGDFAGEPRAHRGLIDAGGRRWRPGGRRRPHPDRPDIARKFRRPTVLDGRRFERDHAHGDLRPGAVRASRGHAGAGDRHGELGSTEIWPALFTTSGASARKFRYEAEVGNIGINIGVAAPMAFFRSAARARVSSAICTARAATPSSSSRRRKSWSNAGPRPGPAVSDSGRRFRPVSKPSYARKSCQSRTSRAPRNVSHSTTLTGAASQSAASESGDRGKETAASPPESNFPAE